MREALSQNMYQGVIKDEARLAQKKLQRQQEMDDQALRRAYLQSIQPVSNPQSCPAPHQNVSAQDLKDRNISFDGCQTCKD